MTFHEKRRQIRSSATLDAFISTDAQGARLTPCTVRDFSETGARLECATARSLPERLVLTIPGRSEIREALVRWRKADSLGVEFVEAQAMQAAAS